MSHIKITCPNCKNINSCALPEAVRCEQCEADIQVKRNYIKGVGKKWLVITAVIAGVAGAELDEGFSYTMQSIYTEIRSTKNIAPLIENIERIDDIERGIDAIKEELPNYSRYSQRREYALIDQCIHADNHQYYRKSELLAKRQACICALESIQFSKSEYDLIVDSKSFSHLFKAYLRECNRHQ